MLKMLQFVSNRPSIPPANATVFTISRRQSLLSLPALLLPLSLPTLLVPLKSFAAADPDPSVLAMMESQVNTFYANREFAPALELLDAILKIDPKNPRWTEFRGAVRLDAKLFDLALEDYDSTLALLTRDDVGTLARVLAGRALVFEGLSKWPEALVDYDAALLLGQRANLTIDPYLLNARGNVLASLERYEEARDAYLASSDVFQQARGLRGRNGTTTERLDGAIYAASNAALMAVQLGRDNEGLREMERLARRAPGSVDMRAALAAMYFAQRSVDKAEGVWNVACEQITAGCGRYRDEEWLRTVRRWPPRMVELLRDFLTLKG